MCHRRIPLSELALAYELRTDGVPWKRIALAIGQDPTHLRDAVQYVVAHGFRSEK